MNYHLPVLSRATTAAAEQLGGVPDGLPADRWPRCADCGRPQSLIAQLRHAAGRLDLGGAGRILFLFQCEWEPGMCTTWALFSGANLCLVMAADDQRAGPTVPPDPAPPPISAAAIIGWTERDDGIAADLRPAFFDDAAYAALDDEVWERATAETRLGGVPHWIQSADEAPKDGWRFLGQLDSTYRFAEPDGGTAYAEGPNFGGGLAYLFARDRPAGEVPEVAMFWQCG